VFVVGCLGDWRAAAAVLFERHSMQGHSAPKREKREDVAGTIGARTGLSSGAQDAMSGHMIPEISRCLVAGGATKERFGNGNIDSYFRGRL
jgi:DNA (cytosine-5)-methyltransferase 1